ncbi:hypothetical protein ACIBMX_03305 [Streptomyces phaeochromogenes]|uniref:hypothetical protein n=1 Tax=Streptomyces phaeochromogenes TaxID=1923 RepID=UPI0033E176F0
MVFSPRANRSAWIRSQESGLDAHVAFVRERRKRNVCSERGLYRRADGFSGGGDDPYYVDRMVEHFSRGEVAYQSYFDHDRGGGAVPRLLGRGEADSGRGPGSRGRRPGACRQPAVGTVTPERPSSSRPRPRSAREDGVADPSPWRAMTSGSE